MRKSSASIGCKHEVNSQEALFNRGGNQSCEVIVNSVLFVRCTLWRGFIRLMISNATRQNRSSSDRTDMAVRVTGSHNQQNLPGAGGLSPTLPLSVWPAERQVSLSPLVMCDPPPLGPGMFLRPRWRTKLAANKAPSSKFLLFDPLFFLLTVIPPLCE